MENQENDYANRQVPSAPNATAATVASILLPGLGQLINGDVGKGLGMIAATIVFWYFVWPLALVLCAWSAFDAYGRANELIDEFQGDAMREAEAIAMQISATDFVTQIEKIAMLAASGMLSDVELSDRKQKAIRELKRKSLIGSSEDFLTALIPLMKNEVLTKDELTQIKSLVPS